MIGEPDLCNPNSYENVCLILRNLGHRAGIKKYNEAGNKQWIYLEVVGTIYAIVKELIVSLLFM